MSTSKKQVPWSDVVCRFGFNAIGIFVLAIAVAGIYLPGVPTTGPLILSCYLIGKGSPNLRARVLALPLLHRYHGYIDGSTSFGMHQRLTAILCMWVSIAVSCLMLLTAGVTTIALPACIAGGAIGTVVILRFRRGLRPAPANQGHSPSKQGFELLSTISMQTTSEKISFDRESTDRHGRAA